jgi:dihydrolipoamide dehydrogenase
LTVSSFDKDFSAVVQRSRSVAENEQRSSIPNEKNKIDVIDGFGKLKPGKKIDVTAKDNTVTEYSADHIILLLSLLVNYPILKMM